MALKQRVQTVEYNSLSQEQNNVIQRRKTIYGLDRRFKKLGEYEGL